MAGPEWDHQHALIRLPNSQSTVFPSHRYAAHESFRQVRLPLLRKSQKFHCDNAPGRPSKNRSKCYLRDLPQTQSAHCRRVMQSEWSTSEFCLLLVPTCSKTTELQ